MKQTIRWLKVALPFIENAAEHFHDQDENTTGRDDQIGDFLDYVAMGIRAISAGRDLPKPPESLQ